MIGGYETRKAGVCSFEGVKTRRFLNAPVSLDFKHSIGAIGSQTVSIRDHICIAKTNESASAGVKYWLMADVPRLAVNAKRYFLEISQAALAEKHSEPMINAQLNDLADVVAKESKALIVFELMDWYRDVNLNFRACNRERYMLDSVNQNI